MSLNRPSVAVLLLAAAIPAIAVAQSREGSARPATQATATATPAAANAATIAAPLIERSRLFGNPTRTGAQISPDGRWLSWIAPRDGVLNIWVAPTADPASAKPLTAEKVRPIRQYRWSPGSDRILFLNDTGGDENYLLYDVPVTGGAVRPLTPFPKTTVQLVGVSPQVRDRILVGLNNRDPRWHDLYSLDLASGKLTQVMRNDGYDSFSVDQSLTVRGAEKTRPTGEVELYRVVDNRVAATPAETIGLDDSMATSPIGYSGDGRTLYMLDNRGRDTAALTARAASGDGAPRVLGQDPRADVTGVIWDPRTRTPLAYSANYLRNEWTALDPAVGADLAHLKATLKGEINVASQTEDNRRWIVTVDPVTAPASTWLYERDGRKLTKLYVSRPELEGAPLQPMHPREIRARDGRTLVSYLTLPPGSDADGDGRPERPVPMVLLVHGGPWARDVYGYNGTHQWLANRGYGVLSVNYRTSTGFGKDHLNAGKLQWGRAMHDDLIDAVAWAEREGVTAKDRVAIMGGSYGGYATLAGLTLTPDAFACGVDIVGPSNLVTLYESFPPYWQAGRVTFAQRMGDPNTAEGRRMLMERSPITHVAAIKRPLLIGQGANDPRVVKAESDQIVEAMRARNIPVTYVLFPDEGHGFARPVNNIAFNAVTENFLQRCLGGRAEPIGTALAGSSAQVPHGAAYAPGLEAALRAR